MNRMLMPGIGGSGVRIADTREKCCLVGMMRAVRDGFHIVCLVDVVFGALGARLGSSAIRGLQVSHYP